MKIKDKSILPALAKWYLLIDNLSYSPHEDFIPNENMYNSQRFFIPDKVYDLIKAGLVEKESIYV